MPNWSYLLITLLYSLSLALWIGGGIVLGAVVAPTLFGTLSPRSKAGEVFGTILTKFARLKVLALVVAIIAAALKYLTWETHARGVYGTWILVRWVALAVMAGSAVYEIFYLQKRIHRSHAQLDEGLDPSDPSRAEFRKLHWRAEALMKTSLVAALVALFFN